MRSDVRFGPQSDPPEAEQRRSSDQPGPNAVRAVTPDLSSFRAAVAFTETLIGPTHASGIRARAEQIALGEQRLARTRRLLELLGNPERAYPIVHVGGTSGKGSTATLLGGMLRAAGYRTGVHTSPYLQSPVEKIEVDGAFISPDAFVALVDACRPAIERMAGEALGAPTYTELWAALPLLHFAREGVDVAVVEVSAGGRFDATNVVSPVVSVITTVGYDHMQSLGGHITDIAWHKAGIIKPGVPAVTGVHQPEALAVIEDEAARQGAPLRAIAEGRDYVVDEVSLSGTTFHLLDDVLEPLDEYERRVLRLRFGLGTGRTRTLGEVAERFGLTHERVRQIETRALRKLRESSSGSPPQSQRQRQGDAYRVRLLGRHQASNAALALAALDASGMRVPFEARRAGLAWARIAGRLESIQEPAGTRPRVLLDGAHNGEKAAVLAAALGDLFPETRIFMVLGVIQGKALHHVVEPLAPLAARVIATECGIPGKPATPAAEIASVIERLGVPVTVERVPEAAIERTLDLAGPRDLVCVTGSLYLVGRARERWIPESRMLSDQRA